MEKTVSSPFWTGMTLFTVRRHGGRKHHLLDNRVLQPPARVAFKGQVFSAPLDWCTLQEQLDKFENSERNIMLPHVGQVLASMVKVIISSGLVSLNKHIRQATVRRNVVVQLIRMFRDAGHPDYQPLNMKAVEQRSRRLTDSDDPAIPNGLADLLDEEGEQEEEKLGVDKAATPAERIWDTAEIGRHMEHMRPNILVAQRDSDAAKQIEASRA